jgi:hypothetical protein
MDRNLALFDQLDDGFEAVLGWHIEGGLHIETKLRQPCDEGQRKLFELKTAGDVEICCWATFCFCQACPMVLLAFWKISSDLRMPSLPQQRDGRP